MTNLIRRKYVTSSLSLDGTLLCRASSLQTEPEGKFLFVIVVSNDRDRLRFLERPHVTRSISFAGLGLNLLPKEPCC